MTRTPSTPGARQAKAEIPTDEQRVKAHYGPVELKSEGRSGYRTYVRLIANGIVIGRGSDSTEERAAFNAYAEAASHIPASPPAEGPEDLFPPLEAVLLTKDEVRAQLPPADGEHFLERVHAVLNLTTESQCRVLFKSVADALKAKLPSSLPAEGVALPELPPLVITEADQAATMTWEKDVHTDMPDGWVPVAWYVCRERQLLAEIAAKVAALSESAALRKQLEEAQRLAHIYSLALSSWEEASDEGYKADRFIGLAVTAIGKELIEAKLKETV